MSVSFIANNKMITLTFQDYFASELQMDHVQILSEPVCEFNYGVSGDVCGK